VAASAPAPAQAPGLAFPIDAAAAENPMDRLRRRLADKLGSGGKLEEDGTGDLRVVTGKGATTSTKPANPAAAPQPPAPGGHVAWGYEGSAGPAAWGRLHPEFAQCANGKRQSPIDIRDGIKVHLDPVQFSYKPSSFRVLDTGHTVQVNVSAGNVIEVMGRRYELHQFHFHRPSEERIDGKPFDMVIHFVHKDPEGRLAVVAVLLESGSAQPLIQTVWNNLPLEKGDEVVAKSQIDLASLLPAERGYHIYMGSLTTPPCTEGVLWMVMKTPVTLSPAQIDIFARLYPMNARPVQPLAGRLIKESQ
jgi:carbonic anhydrase